MNLPLEKIILGPFYHCLFEINILGGFIDMEDDLFLQRKIDIESRSSSECVVLDRLVRRPIIDIGVVSGIAQYELRP